MPHTRKPRLLVIDDDPAVTAVLRRLATSMGFEVHSRENGEAGLAALETLLPDAALVDYQMPGINGVDVIRAIRAMNAECAVVFMSGAASIDNVIEAVKAGATDYVPKPFPMERLRQLLSDVLESTAARRRVMSADAAVATAVEFQGMVGRAPQMQELFSVIRRLAPHARTVLVTGETGTGKELVARAFHAMSPRRGKRLVTVNCSAIVESLFESELFGHVRGAFTGAVDQKVGLFEHANGGTLFLDEIGELPLALQPKLLRAVESGDVQRVGSLDLRQIDVHVIAATNRDLRAEAAAGRFRSDLFYRLGIIEVHLPPLRDRRDDIPYLTAAILNDCAKRHKRPMPGVSTAAELRLRGAAWPGNVRELRNVLERASLMTDAKILSERDIVNALSAGHATASVVSEDPADAGLLATATRSQVRKALADHNGNKAAAARQLGVSRRALYRWIDKLDLD
jgi:two-component system response regulator HydG